MAGILSAARMWLPMPKTFPPTCPADLSRRLDGPGKAFARWGAAVHAAIRDVAANSRIGPLKSSHSTIIGQERKLRRIRGGRHVFRVVAESVNLTGR